MYPVKTAFLCVGCGENEPLPFTDLPTDEEWEAEHGKEFWEWLKGLECSDKATEG